MKTRITAFLTLLFTLSFLGMSVSEISAGSKDGKNGASENLPASYFLQKSESGSSTAKVFRTDVGTNDLTFKNPYTDQNMTTWGGTFYGTVDGEDGYFYCVDLQHQIAFYTNKNPHKYVDEESTPAEITYVLNNYYPYAEFPYTGSASTKEIEAAAVQMVMWHYSDGVDLSTLNSGEVKTRALQIQADADANATLFVPLETLILVPASQTVPYGTSGSFFVSTFDTDGNPLGGVAIDLSTTSGTLSETSIVTTSTGAYGPITITQGSGDDAKITAIADVVVPHGTRYVHKWSPGVYQKLVLATPAGVRRKVEALVHWYQQGNDGCNTNGYLTYTKGGWGSKSNSEPGQVRDQYFDTVFPNGLVVGKASGFALTLTSPQAVEDFLPSGGGSEALTQNWVDPVGTLANNLADQTVALTLNVMFDQAGKIGTNPIDIGDLIIFGGAFDGMSVYDLLDIANSALAGETVGYDLSDITNAAASVNENFDNGTVDEGYLTCEPVACESNIGDYVWHDKDLDGKQDSDEIGIPNVLVNLIYDGNIVATSTTDNDGKYGFADLANGNYTVEIDASNFDEGGPLYHYYATRQNNASDDKDSDGDKNTHSAFVAIDCADDLTIDFGFFLVCLEFEKTGSDTVKPGDQIIYDFRVFNCGDVKLGGGVTVYDSLINPVGNHQIWYKTVYPGESYTFQASYTATEDDCGDLVNIAKAIGHPADVSWSNAQSITVFSEWTTYVDCEEECVGKIGDRVWLDFSSEGDENNCNGLQDAGEPGIANVKVVLKDSEGTVIAHTYTGLDGYYIFEALCDGVYTVEIDETTLPEGVTPNESGVGEDRTIDSNGSPYTVTLSEGNRIDLTIDFGYCVEEQQEQEADLRINKEASDLNPENGDQITYTITVTNDGPATVNNVEVYDVLPSGLVFNSATASQGTYDETTGLWAVGTLAGGASATLGVTVTVDVEVVNNSYFDLGPATGFNVFVWRDIDQPSSDTEGKMAVGRNATLGMYSIGDKLTLQTPPEDVLIVGNNLTYTSGAVYNGNVVYGNSTNLPVDQVSFVDGTLRKDNVIDFDAAKSYLQSLSSQLAGYAQNGTVEEPYASGLMMTGTDPFLNVFNIDGNVLSQKTDVQIDVPNGSVVLVNVNRQEVSMSGGLVVRGTDVGNVLYNFHKAKTLNIQGIDVRGSILAPKAVVNFSAGVQNGQMIAKSVYGSGQFNNHLFVGNIPSTTEITNCAEVMIGEENPGSDCDFEGLTTYTQGGWGSPSSSTPGEIRDTYFDTVLPSGLIIGGTNSLTLTSAEAVKNFLPAGGTSAALDQDYTDASSTSAGVLAGQLVAATLNVKYSEAGVLGSGSIGDLVFVGTEFEGKTINEFLVIANAHIGGDASDYDFSEINVAATMINENFDNGNQNLGYFICEGGSTSNTTVTDPNPENNNDCVTITVGYEPTSGGGSTGGSTGGTWEPAASFGLTDIVYVMTNDLAGNMLAGTWGGKIYRNVNGEWSMINQSMNVAFIWDIEVTEYGYIFVATEKGVYVNIGEGQWTLVGLEEYDVRDIAFDSNGYLYAGTWGGGVFKSEDDGATWTAINDGLVNLAINSLAVTSDNVLFAATFGTGIAKYDGTSWTQLENSYQVVWTVSVSSDDVLYAGTYGDGLHISSDYGTTWTKAGSLPAMYIYSLLFDASGNLYVSSWAAGIYVSASSGTSADFQSVGLGGAGVSSVFVDPANSKLYAGTTDGQIYGYNSNVTGAEDNNELPTEYALEQNYPNPFNPSTVIKFSLVESGTYMLKVYNILGQEVVTLMNDQLNAGNFTVTFDASKLASGIYIYQLSGNNVNIVKKMMLMK